ncbi:BMP family ABC transporter substrate-binding protein [Oceanobacillus halotolerans]|uniref:BMP family ABC transporter substrate-binding protein n=1 Tax=Oceanobacillus halotolerans TaxID=2663380 RepID=UPI0013D999FB|nr:BMP family ABC transporter substrate-binding protein [Oceanobacillus halotolerans]
MLKQLSMYIGVLIGIVLLAGCNYFETGNVQNVGMLVENTIEGHPWEEKGHRGLMSIADEYEIDVYVKENVQTAEEIDEAIGDMVHDGVNLIFGHSSNYGQPFVEIAESYPDVHFVYFNGGYTAENVTSLNFNSHAMGFFAGMIAGEMTNTNEVGIIGAYEWQPEVEGFYEGVKYQNPMANVHMRFVNDWRDTHTALDVYDVMKNDNVDVFYPTGDAFSATVINHVKDDGLYAIGYVTDQSTIDDETVLTSTIQHVDHLYEIAAEKFNDGTIKGTVETFDFQDDVITLGEFSDEVPESFQEDVKEYVEQYKETSLLPNEIEVD